MQIQEVENKWTPLHVSNNNISDVFRYDITATFPKRLEYFLLLP